MRTSRGIRSRTLLGDRLVPRPLLINQLPVFLRKWEHRIRTTTPSAKKKKKSIYLPRNPRGLPSTPRDGPVLAVLPPTASPPELRPLRPSPLSLAHDPRGRIPVRPSQHLAALLCNIRAVRAPFLPAPNARPFPPRATPRAARPRSHIAMRLVRPPRAFALLRQGTAPRPRLTCALSSSGLPSLLDSVFLDLAGWAPVVLAARATPPAP